jgi:FdhD protein
MDASPVDDEPTDSPRPAMRKASVDRSVVQIIGTRRRVRRDRVAGEEPLEIRVVGPDGDPTTVAITMRTPGHDFALAVGFLATEGVIRHPDEVWLVEYCTRGVGVEQLYNIVTVRLGRTVPEGVSRRALLTSASCGICGTTTLDDLEASLPSTPMTNGPVLDAAVIVALPDRLREEQKIFARTGGLHGVGLFDGQGRSLVVREDIGRHNAVDKVIGEAILGRSIELTDAVLVVSGRVSFEIVQKAAMVEIAMVVAVSAPSSLAIDAAERFGITLVGFVRDGGANIYTHAHRVL